MEYNTKDFINFREGNAYLKGLFGEMVVKNNLGNTIKPKKGNFWIIEKLVKDGRIEESAAGILRKYWDTIDLVRFIKDDGKSILKIQVLEVKTKKFYRNIKARYLAHKTTRRTVDCYKECRSNNIDFKLAYVVLFRDWFYAIKLKEFDPSMCSIYSKDGSRWDTLKSIFKL